MAHDKGGELSNTVYHKVELIPDDENGDYRAVAEWSNSGGLVHIVVYDNDPKQAFWKLPPIMRKLVNNDEPIAWEEIECMEAPY